MSELASISVDKLRQITAHPKLAEWLSGVAHGIDNEEVKVC